MYTYSYMMVASSDLHSGSHELPSISMIVGPTVMMDIGFYIEVSYTTAPIQVLAWRAVGVLRRSRSRATERSLQHTDF